MDYVSNLRAVYQRATPLDIAEGRLWYPAARGEVHDLAKQYSYPLKRVAFAAAALSNNMEWGQNVALAEHVCWAVRNGVPARGHYPACLDKAVRILRDGDYAALSGPKVEPFARALLGDMRAAVVDRWMYRAAAETGWVTEFRTHNIAAALRTLAREYHKPVAVLQAIIWVTIRREADV